MPDCFACRLLGYTVLDGPANMALDELLLEQATSGQASLRFYGWSEPTVSLGYFQPHSARLPGLPYVRRASGGLMLVHHHEITYALALPAGTGWQGAEPWLRRMHRIIATALARWPIASTLHDGPDRHLNTPLCFRHITRGDLCVQGNKIVGSAQRKQRGALLQHGGILLARSPLTPELLGIRELTGCELKVEEAIASIGAALRAETRWPLETGSWTDDELERRDVLVREKYAAAAWNDRR